MTQVCYFNLYLGKERAHTFQLFISMLLEEMTPYYANYMRLEQTILFEIIVVSNLVVKKEFCLFLKQAKYS